MTGREAALQVLTACRQLEAWSDGSLKTAVRGMERREAAFAARLTYGILQNRARLDYYLDCFCSQPFQKLEPFVRDVLRIGAYQILYLERVPDSAAVSEAVEMVKTHRRQRAAGMVNAVLRELSRRKHQLPRLPDGTAEEQLSLAYSHPLWLVQRLTELLGTEEAERFLQEDNQPVPVVVQRNPLLADVEQLMDNWQKNGVTATAHPWLTDCWLLQGTGNLEEDAAFQQGWFQVQDAAAKAVVLAADAGPGQRVLDVCAAPGGKSFALAMAMANRGEIISCDIHRHKLDLVERNARRLGITCIQTQLADGGVNQSQWNESFDLVVCDVPCSGFGIIRKKPDIRYKNPEVLAGLPPVQAGILENASRYVKPRGQLLYATCTIFPEENQQITAAFLEKHPEFQQESFSVGPWQSDGSMTFWPQRHGTDGFYVCKMRKQ